MKAMKETSNNLSPSAGEALGFGLNMNPLLSCILQTYIRVFLSLMNLAKAKWKCLAKCPTPHQSLLIFF